MQIDLEETIKGSMLKAIQEGIREGISNKLRSNYNDPIGPLVVDSIANNRREIVELITGCISSAISNPLFREMVRAEIYEIMGKMLAKKFGGELEKQMNDIKSNPATRAKITLAIEGIMNEKSKQE